jgi:glycosidase
MLGKKPDEAIREPLRWTSEKDPHTTTWESLRFNIDQMNSVEMQRKNTLSLYHQYKNLIALRHSTYDLLSGDIKPYFVHERALAYIRGNTLIIHNLSSTPISLIIPKGFEYMKRFPIEKGKMQNNMLSGYSTVIFQNN